MLQRVLPRTSFEEHLPEGWFLSRLYKGNRILYYKDIKVARIFDSFDIEETVTSIINNPPKCVQSALYKDGRLTANSLDIDVQKRLVRQGIISYEAAINCIDGSESWINQFIPSVAEYAGVKYKNKRNRWYDEEGNCINSSLLFLSIWDARVKYSQGICTLADVARYSWSAVLECLGDDHQKYVDNVIKPKLIANKKSLVIEAKYRKSAALQDNLPWEHTEWDETDKIQNDYQKCINSGISEYFFESVDNHVQMFTESCNLKAFSKIKFETETYEKSVLDTLRQIEPRLCKFRWNALLKSHEPVFSPQRLSHEKHDYLLDLIHRVLIGKISGHAASLLFVNGDYRKIKRETDRYEKHMNQYIPFYSEIKKKVSPDHFSFGEAVSYIINNVRDLIRMGYRKADKVIASFTYDNCRFSVNVANREVIYIGVSTSKYMTDKWLKLKPEQRRVLLGDDAEWEYQEKAIKSYNRLFSYLFNVVHKHWDRITYYIKDKLTAKRKYLRPSSGFLDRMKEKAEKYIKSLERRVVTC